MKWQAASAVAVSLALAACNPEAQRASSDSPPPSPPDMVQPAALGRAEIVAALALAASAHAAGASPSEGAAIAGRTFSIRLPFGCFGPAEPGNTRALEVAGPGLASWTWSADRQSQTLSLTPTDWTRSPLLIAEGAEPPWEHAAGYWIARPWLESDVCPANPATPGAPPAPTSDETPETGAADPVAAPTPAPPAPPPFTAGLASIRDAESSRLGRQQGGAYSFVVRGSADAPAAAPQGGYRVVLQGRVSTFPDGHAVRCTTENPNRRPVCVAAVVLDSVSFETADGERLSEWRPEG